MFTSKYKLDGIDNILNDIGYLDEMKGAGEDQEDKYTKKSGKKSKDFDGDGDVEDQTDEYAGVKDRAIKKATGKTSECSECDKKSCDCEDTKKESVNISTVLDELSDEDIIFLSDDLIEEVVEEFFYETLSEGFEVDELETLLTEQLTFELRYLEEAKITVGHDSDEVEQPESSRTSKLAKIGSAIKKVASGAKKVAKKIGGAAGEVAGATVAGFKKASASSEQDDDDDDSSSTGSQQSGTSTSTGSRQSGTSATPKKVTQTGTQRPGILGRVGAALKSGLKKVVYGAGKIAGKVVKTAKAGYQDGASNSTLTAKPVAASPVAKKSKGKLSNLIAQVQKETAQSSKEKTIMETKDYHNLQEAYLDVYEQDEILDEAEVMKHQKERSAIERRKKMKGYEPPTKGVHGEIERRQAQKPPSKLRSGSLPESKEVTEDLDKACWKGYKAIGMKDKGGKKVPNCVPKEEYVDLERDMLEEGYTFDQILEVISAYEDGLEVIFEEDGVVIDNNMEYIEEDVEFLSDVEMVADWLYAEGVIENEDQFFGLMEDMSEEEIEELYSIVSEATAMTKRGYDEVPIRNKIANKTAASGAGSFADKAGKLADTQTYGQKGKGAPDSAAREKLARTQRGDFRNTTSSRPGLSGYAHQSSDPAVKAKQAARGNQRARAALTPNERTKLNMGYEMIGNSLEEGGLEVRNYSWKEVMESQAARNNPEKYEADQKKKSAPVRGEKTPMPPRGDKRREDFEKWYATNVK